MTNLTKGEKLWKNQSEESIVKLENKIENMQKLLEQIRSIRVARKKMKRTTLFIAAIISVANIFAEGISTHLWKKMEPTTIDPVSPPMP